MGEQGVAEVKPPTLIEAAKAWRKAMEAWDSGYMGKNGEDVEELCVSLERAEDALRDAIDRDDAAHAEAAAALRDVINREASTREAEA